MDTHTRISSTRLRRETLRGARGTHRAPPTDYDSGMRMLHLRTQKRHGSDGDQLPRICVCSMQVLSLAHPAHPHTLLGVPHVPTMDLAPLITILQARITEPCRAASAPRPQIYLIRIGPQDCWVSSPPSAFRLPPSAFHLRLPPSPSASASAFRLRLRLPPPPPPSAFRLHLPPSASMPRGTLSRVSASRGAQTAQAFGSPRGRPSPCASGCRRAA